MLSNYRGKVRALQQFSDSDRIRAAIIAAADFVFLNRKPRSHPVWKLPTLSNRQLLSQFVPPILSAGLLASPILHATSSKFS